MRIGWKLLEQWAKNMQRESDRFKVTFTIAMSKIWAAVSVQCQAFLMKNDFLDSEWYGYVFLVKKHVKPYIFSFSGSWATKWLLWQLPLVSEKSKMAAQNGRQSPVMSLKTGLSPHIWLYILVCPWLCNGCYINATFWAKNPGWPPKMAAIC